MRSIGEVTAAIASIRSLTWRQWLVGIVALAIVIAPLPRLYGATATSMEEGSILEYATLTLHGSVPTKDYWTEYGPLNVYVPTVAFAVTGPSVPVERTVGLLYRAVLILAQFSLLRRFSRRGAWIGALLSWFAIAPFGLMAYSLIGGLGCTLAGLALLTSALDRDPPSTRALIAAGIAYGVGLGFRPDLVLVAVLPASILLWRRRSTLRPLLVSAGATIAVPYGILLGTAGFSNVVRCLLIDPLIHLRAGRALPVPPSFTPRWRVLHPSHLILRRTCGPQLARRPGLGPDRRVLLGHDGNRRGVDPLHHWPTPFSRSAMGCSCDCCAAPRK